MKTALFVSILGLLLGGLQGEGSDARTPLEMPDIGLAMTYPKTWQVNQIKKSNDYKALIPIEGSSQKAELELYNVGFDAEKSIWQLSQKGINERMRRDVMRQWEEEFLGVPLLLTKVSYSDKQGPHILLTGLMYSRTPKKLMFRLTASPDDFDKAEYAWRGTMQTFRTGIALKPEDPNNKPDPKKGGNETVSAPPVLSKPKSLDDGQKVVTPPLSLEATVAARKIVLRYPSGWAAKADDKGVIVFTNPDVTGKVQVTLASTLDSDAPDRALFLAASKTLEDYQKVSKRDEKQPEANKAGGMLATVWRAGTSAQGDLYTCDASVAHGDFYCLLSYRTTDSSKIGSERKAIEALLDSITLDLAQ